ncbi:Similar to Structural maintenance of chromosomes protein 5; acc. no. O13710 [Pyronema omphalodes CBS 100304]|uniref:Structural maintenance of chromosomes protein 5 n=1 Tax=Pyronema omphalodes (strain CBS 100304) TaxID=1076935 RepID=U4KZW7_PYROM|nr:Similar to Structural maintenance of chromosomes protein 5; acc. no. O13710 [Pyronema omphalodes CBS 100304]
MPSVVPSKRRVIDDSDVSDDDSGNTPPPAQRANRDSDLSDDDASVDENVIAAGALQTVDLEEIENQQEVLEDVAYEDIGPDNNVFQAGAIVRVSCRNFITYNEITMHPGPSLNMVIGPNGTGKSSIVSAICIGLGFSPKLLNRAEDLSAFVKNGEREGHIEIELQGRPGEQNPVIRRKIIKDNNSSSFYLNGKSVSHKAVLKLVRSYDIQIDNPCQFLPQDCVDHFSKLSEPDRLRQTERAVAGPEMLNYHDTLIKLYNDVAKEKETLKTDKAVLEQLQNKQKVLQQDVDRMRERQEVMKKIESLKRQRPYIKYMACRKTALEAKEVWIAAKQELEALQQESKPAMERPEAKRRYKEAIKDELDRQERRLDARREQCAKQRDQVIPNLKRKIDDIQARIEAETEAEKKGRETIKELTSKIASATKKLQAGPPEYNSQAFQDKIQEAKRNMRSTKQQLDEHTQEIENKRTAGANIKRQIQYEQNEIDRLESVAGQREELLPRVFGQAGAETLRAWRWYQENKDLFEQEIFPPPVICVSVKEPRVVNAVEHLIQSCSTSFTCQNSNDYNKFTREVIGVRGHEGLSLGNITIKDFSGSRAPHVRDHRPQVTKEQLSQLGFEGYALDYLDGPEPVLNMLCHDARIHNTPLSPREFSEQENKRCEQMQLAAWFAGNTMYQFRSRYGASTTLVSTIRQGNVYKMQQVDPTRKREIKQRISELEYQLKETEREINTIRSGPYQELRALEVQYANEIKELENDKKIKQHAIQKFNQLQAQLMGWKDDVVSKQEQQAGYKDTFQELEQRLVEAQEARAEAIFKLAEMVAEFVNYTRQHGILKARFLEASSDEKHLQARNEHIIQSIDQLQKTVKIARDEFADLKDKASKYKDLMVKALDDATEAEREEIQNLPKDKTVEDVDEELDTANAHLDLFHDRNPNALKQYDERKASIQQLEAKIEALQDELAERDAAIDEVQKKWEPELDKLVHKISTAFSKSFKIIGCAGEVKLAKSDEGYDKWGIEILVKFRENEELRLLDQWRQSGGERSVSTIYYIMALQSIAKSPFRVVDEINQGMDPRNERLVHYRMVNIACQQHNSQYFLITPKILNDLQYHPRMRVHCIYAGEWMDENISSKMLDYIKLGRKAKGKGRAAEEDSARRVKRERLEEQEDDE